MHVRVTRRRQNSNCGGMQLERWSPCRPVGRRPETEKAEVVSHKSANDGRCSKTCPSLQRAIPKPACVATADHERRSHKHHARLLSRAPVPEGGAAPTRKTVMPKQQSGVHHDVMSHAFLPKPRRWVVHVHRQGSPPFLQHR